jgi:hypothetical protein
LEDAELVAKMMVIASFMGGGGAEDRAADYLRRLVAEVRERRAHPSFRVVGKFPPTVDDGADFEIWPGDEL